MERVSARGSIVRVSGPLVEVEGVGDLAMADVVALGPERMSAETVEREGDRAVLQAYEYTGGLRSGDVAESTGAQLSIPLGPGLLGQAFDGLLRPLTGAGLWLGAARSARAPGHDRSWRFTAVAHVGDEIAAGDVIGTVADAGSVEHRVLVPADSSGILTWLADEEPLAADAVVARVGDRDVRLTAPWPIRRPRPFRQRLSEAVPLRTGQRVLDLLFPVAQGATAAVPGGFGAGKTLLLQQIAKWSDADVIVYVGCGERGNEMADVLGTLTELSDARTGGRLIDRTVIIANTSNMPMMAREAGIHTGVTVAEYYRDMGYDVVVIADSTSRWAEALREFANRNGQLPAEEGYPASLASELAAFYERAGRVDTFGGRTASVTVIGAVSPPGGDMTEPVTTATQRFARTLWQLDRDLAYARHYPAVSWTASFARDDDAIGRWYAENGDAAWAARRARAITMLAESDRLASLAELLGQASLPGHERMILLGGRLVRDGVLMQSALSPNDVFCSAAKAAAILDLVLDVADRCALLASEGVPAAAIERIDFGDVLRARDETGPDDAAGVEARREPMLRRLEALR